jgi:hydroxymethylbilane synthase
MMSDARKTLHLGTRASALAVAQAGWVASVVEASRPDLRVELVRIRTSGDRIQNRSLAEIGGKGLFVKEIEEALLEGQVDFAVHSMKDLPVTLAPGLDVVAVPKRADPHDALIAARAKRIADLPRGARVGTSSLRRRVFLAHLRPDLEVVALRGNVDTRIAKWRAGEIDALVLACAGLGRLGLEVPEATSIPIADMLPAIGQGALAIETRRDGAWWAALAALDDRETSTAVSAERGFLAALGGDCTTPVAAHARLEGATIRLAGAIGDPHGAELVIGEQVGGKDDGPALGRALAEELLARGGRRILDGLAR